MATVRMSTIAALGGFLFGYDTGVISAALLFISSQFQLSDNAKQVVVASLLVGAIVGVASGGQIMDRVGRRHALFLASLVFTLGALVSAVSVSTTMLIVSRLVLGLAIGASSVVVPAYIAEIAPKEKRGALVTLYQMQITIGIFVSYLVGYWLSDSGNWRWMLGLAGVPSLIMLFGLFLVPESPRWLLSQGRRDEAERALAQSRSREEALADIREIEAVAASSRRLNLKDPTLRAMLFLGVAVAATNQLVGVNAIIYYTPTLLQRAGFGDSAAVLASVGVGAVNMIVTIVVLLLIDRFGRRPLLLGGTGIVIVALVFLGFVYLLAPADAIPKTPLVIGLCVYIASFAGSLGMGIWLVNSEIFPTAVRGKAASFGAMTHWVLDFAISLTVLTLFTVLTPPGFFWAYAVLGVIGLVYLSRKLPETKGRSLEEIEALFARRTGQRPS
jgi:sugar porter (SP) family MFS transporter